MERLNMQQLQRDLKKISTGRVLDVATGRGGFINMLMHSLGSFAAITGIDNNQRSVQLAKKQFQKKPVEIIKMDAYDITFPDGSFDTVSISNSLHHFTEIEKILANMKNVLSKDGYFLVNEMHCDEGQTEEQLTHVKMHHWWGKVDSRLGISHNKTFRSAEIEKLIENIGLTEIRAYEYAHQLEDPRDEKMINTCISYLDPYVDRLQEDPDYEELKAEGEKLKERLREVGFAPASSLFILGKK